MTLPAQASASAEARLREPLAVDGEEKCLLDIPTRTVGEARRYWPAADERDVGHLRLHWDWRNPDETASAQAAFEMAKESGVRFFRINEPGEVGEEITDFDAAYDAAVQAAETAAAEPEAAPAGPAPTEPPEPVSGRRSARRGRRGRTPSVVGAVPMRGGSTAPWDQPRNGTTTTLHRADQDGLTVSLDELLQQLRAESPHLLDPEIDPGVDRTRDYVICLISWRNRNHAG